MTALRGMAVLLIAMLALFATAGPAAAKDRGPKALEITTVPPTPGAAFTLDELPLQTDARGVARVMVPASATPHRIAVLTSSVRSSIDSVSEFVRWYGHGDTDQGYENQLDNVRIDHTLRLRVAFRESRTVRFSFVDQAHHAVDPARITSLTLRSDTNQSQTVGPRDAVSLTAVRPSSAAGEVVARDATYSVQSVMIDGANVVNVGEQRFRPSQVAGPLELVLLLRSAHFRVRDRLLGSAVPTVVHLTYPDGHRADLPTDPQGEIVLAELARGTYQVSAAGQAYELTQELALSRSQFVDVPVLSVADAGILGGATALLLCAVVGLGRWRSRRLRKPPASADPP
jgi:hypothetical protein